MWRAAVIALIWTVLLPRTARAQEVVEYYGLDALGSVRVVFDATGAVTGRMDYGPFGEQITSSTVGRKSFAQLFGEGEAGMNYAEARSYQVRTGRFTTADPSYAGVQNPQRWNRYSYSLNAPLTFVDTDGRNAANLHVGSTYTEVSAGFIPMSHMLAFFLGLGGGGSLTESYYDEGGGGSWQNKTQPTTPTNAPLPKAEDTALNNAVKDLEKYQPSPTCVEQVVSKLHDFRMQEFQAFLSMGADFFDGTKSTVSPASLYPAPARNVVAARTPQTMAGWFARNPGLNAAASIVAPRLTAYFRPSAIDTSNGGVNSRNRGLLFHEGLHGFGRGARYMDDDLISSFSLAGPSGGVSAHISANCQ